MRSLISKLHVSWLSYIRFRSVVCPSNIRLRIRRSVPVRHRNRFRTPFWREMSSKMVDSDRTYPVRTSASGKCRLRNGTNHGQSLSLILSPTMADTARQRDTIAYSTLHTDERSSIIDSSRLGSLDADANDDDDDDDDDAASASDHRHHPRPMNRCRRHWEKLQPGSISNLCSATLGAGALSLPYAISLTGIIFGVLLLMVSAYLTIISVDVIIDACVRTQMFKYEDVAQRLVGRRAGRLLEASLLIFCFGVRA